LAESQNVVCWLLLIVLAAVTKNFHVAVCYIMEQVMANPDDFLHQHKKLMLSLKTLPSLIPSG